MGLKILAFGMVADVAGKSEWHIDLLSDTDSLEQQLLEQFPGLRPVSFAVAVNKKIIRSNHVLKEGDTIALLPPFSGG